MGYACAHTYTRASGHTYVPTGTYTYIYTRRCSTSKISESLAAAADVYTCVRTRRLDLVLGVLKENFRPAASMCTDRPAGA